jgi:hypothetical protein
LQLLAFQSKKKCSLYQNLQSSFQYSLLPMQFVPFPRNHVHVFSLAISHVLRWLPKLSCYILRSCGLGCHVGDVCAHIPCITMVMITLGNIRISKDRIIRFSYGIYNSQVIKKKSQVLDYFLLLTEMVSSSFSTSVSLNFLFLGLGM